MAGTLSYNFDPEQTVYAIVSCDASCGAPQRSGSPIGLQISNAQFPSGPAIQPLPATGNIIVREGVVKEIRASIFQNTSNQDAVIQGEFLGGQLVGVTLINSGSGYFPDSDEVEFEVTVAGGAVTAVTIVSPGSGYVDGSGYTLNLTTTAGGGDGLAQLFYNVSGGSVNFASVVSPGSGYVDGTNVPVTDVPDQAANTFLITTTAGGGDGLAQVSYDVINGVIANPIVSTNGSGYTDGFFTLSETPQTTQNDHQLVYRIRFNDDYSTLLIESPVDPDGVELQGDIFDNLSDAIDEYELRIS